MYFYSPSNVLVIFSLFILFPFSFHSFFFVMHLYSLIIIFFSLAYLAMSSSVGFSKSA